MNLTIELSQTSEELRECASLMSSMEPWITLRRNYKQSLETLTEPLSEVYIAKIGEEPVGYAIIQLRGPFAGYVKSILVKPEWQRKGVGKKLMKSLEERIFSEHPNVFLCVSSFNSRAQEFYRGMGYKAVGELKDYIIRGHSEILMRKTVSPIADFKLD